MKLYFACGSHGKEPHTFIKESYFFIESGRLERCSFGNDSDRSPSFCWPVHPSLGDAAQTAA